MALEQAGVQLIAQGASAFVGDMRGAENATNSFVRTTQQGGGSVSAAGQVMIGALRQVGVIAVEAFGQALRAGAAFIGDSVQIAGNFEETMGLLGEVSGATAEEIGQISDKAKALGNDLSLPATSAVDAGNAMLELSKAGFTVQEAMDAAKGTLQLAAAAQIEEAEAAEITANAINAFGLEAKDASFVSDLLAASANASSIEIGDAAASFKMASAVYSTFQGPVVGAKESLVDLTTAIGILGNVGIKGSDAGTSLKQALMQLAAPSEKAKGLMQELTASIGVSGDIAYTAEGKMRPFREIIDLVAQSTAGMTEEQRQYNIATIFGADASRAILSLINQGPAAWDEMSAAVQRSGAASDLAAAQTAGLNGAWGGVQSQIETLQLTIGQALIPILTALLVDIVQPAIATITTFADAVLGSDEAFNMLSPTLQQIVTVIDAVVLGFSEGGLLGALNQLIPGIAEVGGATTGLSAIWETMRGVVENVAAAYQNIMEAVLPIVAGFIEKHGAEISAFFQTTWDQIVVIIQTALQLYNAIVPPILNAIAEFISAHGEDITTFLEAAWQVITSLIDAALTLIQGVIKAALQIIEGDWSGAWETIKSMSARIVEDILAILTGAATMFFTAAKGLIDAILQGWNSFADWSGLAGSVVDGIVSGLYSGLSRVMSAAADLARSAYDAAMSALNANSPSKLFRQLGRWSGEGFMLGMEDMIPKVVQASTAMTMAAPAASAGEIGGWKSATTNIYNGQMGNCYNMPIYTNNSPAIVQQSFAIAQAASL